MKACCWLKIIFLKPDEIKEKYKASKFPPAADFSDSESAKLDLKVYCRFVC